MTNYQHDTSYMERYPLQIQEAVGLLKQMEQNAQEMRIWKNQELARRVVSLLDELPDRGDSHTPYDKIFLLNVLTDNISCSDTPRYAIEVLTRMLTLFDATEPADFQDDDNPIDRKSIEEERQKWADYIDTRYVSADDWCKRYGRHLRFDPVERTERWEAAYEQAEAEVEAEIGPDVPRGMGFCFHYWMTKQNVLMRHGIRWRSPSAMNPGVLFD